MVAINIIISKKVAIGISSTRQMEEPNAITQTQTNQYFVADSQT